MIQRYYFQQEIRSRTTAASAFETKESALSTLRKIGKSMIMTGEGVGRTLRNDGWGFGLVADTMQEVALKMTEEERREEVDGELVDKLEELVGLWDSYGVDQEGVLKEVAEMFRREDSDSDGE